LYVTSITERHASIQKLKFLKQNKAWFTQKQKAAVSRGIWTILPASREILPTGPRNLPRKTVGPIHNTLWTDTIFKTTALFLPQTLQT